jgi:hypothetical protein
LLYSSWRTLECQRGWATGALTGEMLKIGCGSWYCRDCGPRRRADYIASAHRIPKRFRTLKFITTTAPALPPCCEFTCDGTCARCIKDFNHRHESLWQSLGRDSGARTVAHISANEFGPRTDHLHKHSLVDCDYIDQLELSARAERYGLGRVSDIRAVKSRTQCARYLAPYMVKGQRSPKTPRSARMFQRSRGLRPPREPGDQQWIIELITRSVMRRTEYGQRVDEMLESARRSAVNDRLDAEEEARQWGPWRFGSNLSLFSPLASRKSPSTAERATAERAAIGPPDAG